MIIRITDQVGIPEEELAFSASRSGGPGGQNVNKVSSRVTLAFDINKSPSLNEQQKTRIRKKLSNRISKEGVLRVVSQRTRSQEMNKADTIQRFAELIRAALRLDRPRVRSITPPQAKERRLEEKRKRAAIKDARRKWTES